MTRKPAGEPDGSLAEDFLDFIACLNDAGVDAVLVGGYALAVHGVVRATGDIDFLYRRTPANARRLCAAMTAFGAPETIIDPEALMTPDIVTQFGREPFRIDLLNAITGVSYANVLAGSIEVDVQGQTVRVIGSHDLRANKFATGRKKDLSDARALEKLDATSTSKAQGNQSGKHPRRRK